MTDHTRVDHPSCPRNPQAVGLALHALEPDEEHETRAHLVQCPSCQEVVRETELLFGAVGAGVEQVDPAPLLRDRLLAAVAETPQEHRPEAAGEPEAAVPAPRAGGGAGARPGGAAHAVRPPVTARAGPRRRRRWLAAGASVAAVVGFGTLTGYTVQLHAQRDAETAQVERLAEIIVRSRQPGSVNTTLAAEGRPVASVMVVDGRSTVVTSGLTPNSTAATYVLWGVAGTDAQALGTFDVADTGAAPRWSEVVPTEFAGYAISLEPGRIAPASPTVVVAEGDVA